MLFYRYLLPLKLVCTTTCLQSRIPISFSPFLGLFVLQDLQTIQEPKLWYRRLSIRTDKVSLPIAEMDPRWIPQANRPLRVSGTVLVPLILVCNTSLLLPTGRKRVLLTLPTLLYLLFQVHRNTSGLNAEDCMLAVISSSPMRYVTSILFATPEKDMHRVVVAGEKKGTGEPEDPQSMRLWSKLKWSMHFWSSMRGVGWNWRVKNVDDVPEKLQSKK